MLLRIGVTRGTKQQYDSAARVRGICPLSLVTAHFDATPTLERPFAAEEL